MRRASSIFARPAALLAAAALALLAASAAGHASAAPGKPASAPPGPGDVRVLAASAAADPAATVDALERAGYRVHAVLLPGTYYVTGGGRAVLPAAVRPALDDGIGALAGLRAGVRAEAGAAPGGGDPFGGRSDAIEPLPRARDGSSRVPIAPPGVDLPSGLAYGTRWEDTSELMVGRVAVPILFPESDGTIDPDQYDWTPALRDSVLRSAVRGFVKWSLAAAARNLPLTFLIETHEGLATRYEPIAHTIAQEALWIEDALVPLVGYRGNAAAMAYDVANAARARLGAHWACLAFAVQNDSSSTGSFPDGYIAHAQLGGPWLVIPINNLNTTSASLDFYFEHEITHLFWALDEYPAVNAWWSCMLSTGYFNQPNTNSSIPADGYCGVPTVPCIMKGNYLDDFCTFTTRQVGWVDLDNNEILDLYETRPAVRPDSTQYRAGAGQTLTLSGAAEEIALENRNPYRSFFGDPISIATIDSIEYRLDGGPWIPVPCADGSCDFGMERFTIILPPQIPGTHLVEWRAWNSSGMTGTIPNTTGITISGTSAAVPGGSETAPAAPRLTAAPTPSRGPVRLTLRARPGSRGTASVMDVSGRAVRRWPVAVPDGGVLEWEWRPSTSGGGAAAAGLYFVVVNLGPDTATRRVVLLR